MKVIRLLAAGFTAKQIIHDLGIHRATYARHLNRAKAHYGAKTTYQLLYLYGTENPPCPNHLPTPSPAGPTPTPSMSKSPARSAP